MSHRQIAILKEENGIDTIARIPLDDKGEVFCEMDLSSYHTLLGLGYSEKLSYREVGNRKCVVYRDPVTNGYMNIARIISRCWRRSDMPVRRSEQSESQTK